MDKAIDVRTLVDEDLDRVHDDQGNVIEQVDLSDFQPLTEQGMQLLHVGIEPVWKPCHNEPDRVLQRELASFWCFQQDIIL